MCSYCRGLWQLLFIATTLAPSQPSQAQDSLPPSSSLLLPSGTPLPMELGVQLLTACPHFLQLPVQLLTHSRGLGSWSLASALLPQFPHLE